MIVENEPQLEEHYTVQPQPIGFDLDIHGTLLGGTQTLAGDTKFLGFQEMPDVNPAIATLKQVKHMGAV